MKAFWWQDGLHLEPETSEERAALVLIYDSLRKINLRSESASGEELTHRVVGNLKLDPCGVLPNLLHK